MTPVMLPESFPITLTKEMVMGSIPPEHPDHLTFGFLGSVMHLWDTIEKKWIPCLAGPAPKYLHEANVEEILGELQRRGFEFSIREKT